MKNIIFPINTATRFFKALVFTVCSRTIARFENIHCSRHNECGGVSNHQRLDCLLNRLFRRRSKKTWKIHRWPWIICQEAVCPWRHDKHVIVLTQSRWRHQMETFSALQALCAGNSQVSGEFPAQRRVTRTFDVFFDLHLIKQLSKHSRGWWFETLSHPLWKKSYGQLYTKICT